MEESIKKIIAALTEAVEKLGDRPTGDGASMDPRDAFSKSAQQERAEQDKTRAEAIVKEQEKARKKAETEKGRSILKQVMPVNIVGFDSGALKALKDIIPDPAKKTKEESTKKEEGGSLFKKLGLGGLALVLAPVVALVSMFDEISKQKWFLKLKDFVKNSKLGQSIGKVFTSIQKAITSLGKRFPALGKLMGNLFGKGGSLTGIFTKIKTLSTTVQTLLKDSKILSIAGKVGKFLGKLFLPITILWGAIETVMGAVKGYKEDGVAGSIKGGVNALFDFLVVDLVNLIVSIPAWFLKKIGLKNVAKALQENVAGVLQSVKDMFGGIVDTVVGVLTLDPKRIIQGLKGLWEGQKDFVGFIIGLAVDPVVNFLKDVFKFGDPDSPFSFKKDVLDPAVNKIKKWFKGLLSLGKTEDGTWSLSLFINNVEKKIIEFFTGMFTWAKETGTNEDGEWSLITFISGVFESVKSWITGLFNWEEVSKKILVKADWLKTMVTDTWNSVKQWFVDLVTWAETDTDESGQEDGFIVSTIKGVVKSVSTYFSKLFTFDSTSKTITSIINIATWLPNLVVSGLTSVSAWFLKLFGFDEQAKDVKDWGDKFSIGDLVVGAVTSVWDWLKSKFSISANYITQKWNALTGAAADIGTWLYNSAIKPITDWFDTLFADPKGTIESLAPTWMIDVAGWLYDNAIAPIVNWFDTLFADPKGTIESLLPEWMIDVAGWLYTNAFSPIVDWFATLFKDPAGTFKAMLPEWMFDIGSFFYDNLIKPIVDIFEGLLNIDFLSIVKDKIKSIPVVGEKIYNQLFGEEEEARMAAEKTAKTFASVGVDQDAAIAVAQAKEQSLLGRASEDKQEDIQELYEKRITKAVGDKKSMTSGQIDLLASALAADSDAQKSKLGQEVLKLTGGTFDHTNAEHKAILAKQMKAMYADEWTGDDINDQYDDSIEALSKAAGKEVARRRVAEDTVNALIANIQKIGGVKLGQEMYRLDGTTPVTENMIKKLNDMFNYRNNEDIEMLKQAYTKLGITPQNLSSKLDKDIAQDFIWRPGQEPMRFSKGDIVMGLHQDVKPPGASQDTSSTDRMVESSEQLVERVDKMVQIMHEHSEIHGKILEVLQESGLMDKQGNTVVNNGGNSTVINNNTVDSDIMGFRDKVVGRLKHVPTK